MISKGGWRNTQKNNKKVFIYKEIYEKRELKLYKDEFNITYHVSRWAD